MPGLEDELGDVVRKARAGLGLSLDELAHRTQLDARSLKSLEVYTYHPDAGAVRRLAAALGLRPDALVGLAEERWSPPDPRWSVGGSYTIQRLTTSYPEHCYVINGPDGDCLVIDPGDEPDRIVQAVTQGGRRVAGIAITHDHADHTGALLPVQRATGAPVLIHAADAGAARELPASSVRQWSEDGPYRLGGIHVRALHTPGHTAGSATYMLEADGETAAWCGDTLFAGSAGNARHGYDALLSSLRHKLARLPGDTVLFPGHGPATTVANELTWNPFLLDQ